MTTNKRKRENRWWWRSAFVDIAMEEAPQPVVKKPRRDTNEKWQMIKNKNTTRRTMMALRARMQRPDVHTHGGRDL
jgi:hypothetical protein